MVINLKLNPDQKVTIKRRLPFPGKILRELFPSKKMKKMYFNCFDRARRKKGLLKPVLAIKGKV